MSRIREEMPVLVRHEGDWVGTYTLINIQGNILDKHESHLTCQFPEDDSYSYCQINRYKWSNGKCEEHKFPGTYRDKALWFDTERLNGKAWEVDEATIILHFTYKTIPDMYLYEMIQVSSCNNYRSRTWHWFKTNQIYQRTLIQEERMR
ncbi:MULTISPECIES: DUF3598 family protein [unclassified Coleofasciculus]|uniref:DUF3598 family protein n=1 Tax=unclassified Coleofasciculus TaxID=2692782 RepID=UPI00188250D7|nr:MULTISPECIES: DUF3598 family protein [unclassified Coleofasciculus]MBE9125139.1 DUF3598 domain-containing protein [Coleofasciculus sp. LEGE 07081]MBE9148356.1 DUF3598 domain-containing protein [Coleofasciculus sp. LEGE 07092]